MLFNSYAFILGFLPVTFFVFFAVARKSHKAAAAWLMLASFFFYGWWSPKYIALLAFSILFNFGIGTWIQRLLRSDRPRRARAALAFGVVGDLLLLGYFKYANFFVDNLNYAIGTDCAIGEIILPLGISFYTFTQIASQGPGLAFCLLGCARFPEAMQLQNEPTCPVPLSETHRFANTRSSLRRSAGNARSVEGACQTSESIDGDGKQCPRSIGCGTAGASPRLMDSQADS